MIKELKVPDLNTKDQTGVLVAILIEEGQVIEVGDVLFEIETDKVVREFTADEGGKINKIFVDEGDRVQKDQKIMIIEVD